MRFPARSIAQLKRTHVTFFPGFDAGMLRRNLAVFGIEADDRLSEMSDGTYVKAALAYMLSLRCDVLLLDEPTGRLDPTSRRLLGRLLVECVGEGQSVVSTHSLEEFGLLYDSVMMLGGGRLLLHESIDRIAGSLAFVESERSLPDALYSELGAGRWRSVVLADGSMDSQPDITLLFNALSADNREAVLKVLAVSGRLADASDDINRIE